MSLFKTKTFWLGICTAVFGVAGLAIGELDATAMVSFLVAGFGLITGRDAFKKAFEE